MINLDDCIEIGQFIRSHGYKGSLILKLNNISLTEIENMEWVFVIIDGLPVPFFVSDFSERSSDCILVQMEDVNSIDTAKALIDTSVYIEKKILKEDGMSKNRISQIIGYKVIDISLGQIGVLDSIIENPKNPLLRILNKNKEILLPLQNEFIIEINSDTQEIVVNCPSGLLDL